MHIHIHINVPMQALGAAPAQSREIAQAGGEGVFMFHAEAFRFKCVSGNASRDGELEVLIRSK